MICTNDDEYTMQYGVRAPGNGMQVAALENSLKNSEGTGLICTKVVTGKPCAAIVDLICGQHGIKPEERSRMVMIGDRPNTDIALAHNAGIASVLVLSGVVTSEEDAEKWYKQDPKFIPTHLLDSFGETFDRD